MEEPILLLVTYFLVAHVFSVFVHELGHAMVGRWCGMLITSFGVGTRRPLFSVSFLGMRFYFCLYFLSTSITLFISPRCGATTWREISTMLGGLFFNLLLGLLSLSIILLVPDVSIFFWFLMGLNFFFFLINAVPFTFQVGGGRLHSDGALVRSLLRGVWPQPTPSQGIETVVFLSGLLEEVRDEAGLQAQRLAMATYWTQLGDIEGAKAIFDERDPKLFAGLGGSYGGGLILGAALALHTGDREQAEMHLGAAREFATERKDPVVALLADVTAVELHLVREELQEAVGLFDRLSTASLPPIVADAVEMVGLACDFAREEAGEEPSAALLTFPASLSGQKHLMFQYKYAEHAAKHGREEVSQAAYKAYLASWEASLSGFGTPAHRERFIELHRERAERALARLSSTEQEAFRPRVQAWHEATDGTLPAPPKTARAALGFRRILRYAVGAFAVFLITLMTMVLMNGKVRRGLGKLLAHKLHKRARHLAGMQSLHFGKASLEALAKGNPAAARRLLKVGLEMKRPVALYMYSGQFHKAWKERRDKRILFLAKKLISWRIDAQSRSLGHLWQGRLWLRQGKAAQARREFSIAARLATWPRAKAKARIFQALALEKLERPKEAIAACWVMSGAKADKYLALKHCLPMFLRHKEHRLAKKLCHRTLKGRLGRSFAFYGCRPLLRTLGATSVELAYLRRLYTRRIKTQCRPSRRWGKCVTRQWRAMKRRVTLLERLFLASKKPSPTSTKATSRPREPVRSTTRPTTQASSRPAQPSSLPR